MDNETILYIIRHGESEGNISGKFNGTTDLPLDEKGIKQAEALRSVISDIDFDVVYSSNLKRAFQTAELSINDTAVKISIVKDIREINGGEWEGTAWEDIPRRWPDVFHHWVNEPGNLQMPKGESMIEFSNRCISAYQRIISENKGKTILTYSHGTVIKVMQVYFMKKELNDMSSILWHENTGIFCVAIDKDGYKIMKENDISHLPPELKMKRDVSWYKEEKAKIKNIE
ncbi:MAG: histidine phosphatase family protein [Clostridia bacterium]|nr:histidine phosphatase family protein [Clostridia bacterium]